MTTFVFPLAMMRRACELSARGCVNGDFQYRRPMLINQPAASNVYCGNLPLVRRVFIAAFDRFPVGNSCYINTAGEFVFPA